MTYEEHEPTPQHGDLQVTSRALLCIRAGLLRHQAIQLWGLPFQQAGMRVFLSSHCSLAEDYFCPIILL